MFRLLLILAVYCITLNSSAQKIVRMEDNLSTTITLTSVKSLQTDKINHVTISAYEPEAKMYRAKLKFGKNKFELSVYDTKTSELVWGHYSVPASTSFKLTESDYSSSSNTETYRYSEGN